VADPNEDKAELVWFTSISFDGLSDQQADLAVQQLLASAPSLGTHEIAAYHARLQQGALTEQAAAQHSLRIYLLPLALGISSKYPPLVASLPCAIEAIDVAIEKWDPESGFPLGTSASWFIRQTITRDREQ
jgi:hypothetical protein